VRPRIQLLHAGEHHYVDEGTPNESPPVVLLHGLVGGVDNWSDTAKALAARGIRAIIPALPIYRMPLRHSSVGGLAAYVADFLSALEIEEAILGGNSLGGQIAAELAIRNRERVAALVLSGSSGVQEVSIGSGHFRRRDREFIRERAALTFYDSSLVTDDIVDEAYRSVNDRGRASRLLRIARSAQEETLLDRLDSVAAPTLIIWGRDDRITPPPVAETFKERIPDAELQWIDRCGHAPMMEHPGRFNEILIRFLEGRSVASGISPMPAR
jgi:pimeloyl-ACP methyl ester carboxylesterase